LNRNKNRHSTTKTDNALERHPYNSKETEAIINKLDTIRVDGSYYLLILAGRNTKARQAFLSKLSKKTGEISSVDLRSIISTNEEESYANIDKLFNSLDDSHKTILLEYGDVLSGEYTGYTYSTVRYATPQEKYLLKKIQKSEKVVLIELTDKANITKTLERIAQVTIEFDAPDSGLGKLFWKLKQVRLNGHTFENKRPADVG
jgi:hypothetical protein